MQDALKKIKKNALDKYSIEIKSKKIEGRCSFNPLTLVKGFVSSIETLRELSSNDEVQLLLDFMVNEEKIYDSDFFILPASLSFHHSNTFGLLQHTMEVHTLCNNKDYQFSHIDIDKLSCCALLHDYFKIDEYLFNTTTKLFERNKKNKMKNYHIEQMVNLCNTLKLYEFADIFGSHHGLEQWGAKTEPESNEAKILFASDLYSAMYNGNI